jgi:hypothetical protein
VAGLPRFGLANRGVPAVASQAIAPCEACNRVERLPDPCLTGLPSAPPLLPPACRAGLRLRDGGSVAVSPAPSLGASDDAGAPPETLCGGWHGHGHGRCQAMEGARQAARGPHAPWRGPRCGGTACRAVQPAGLGPGGPRPSQGRAGVTCGAQGWVPEPVDACGDVGLADVGVLVVHTRRNRFERSVTRTSGPAAVARGRAWRLPCRVPGEGRSGWPGALRQAGHPARAGRRRARCGPPDPADGLDRWRPGPGLREASPLGRREGWAPSHSGRPGPPVVLWDPSGREAWGGPGLHHESLARVDGLDVARTTGSGAALGALADRPCAFGPRESWPGIPRPSCRVPSDWPRSLPPNRAPVRVSASCPRGLGGWRPPAPTSRWRLPACSGAGPGPPSAGVGCPRAGWTWGGHRRVGLSAGATPGGLPRQREPGAQGPCPFGPRLPARFGWAVLTTVLSHVRGPPQRDVAHRRLPAGAACSCLAPLASPRLLGVRPLPEGGAVTPAPLGWAWDRCPPPHAHQVIKGRVGLCLASPWLAPSFERTGRSPPRTVRAPYD